MLASHASKESNNKYILSEYLQRYTGDGGRGAGGPGGGRGAAGPRARGACASAIAILCARLCF